MTQRLGRYELGRVIGQGGAGRVHEAVLVGPGGFRREVALKILHRGGEELRREARLGGLLRHRNLVDVYEIGEVDGQWFCALERCTGSLTPHLPLPPRAVVEVGLQVCAALQYAHEELGLVHLDLKPDNLLLAAEGVVKVGDLGIARAEGFDASGIRGTRGYMAPEQLRGGPVDARSDLYALGVTLVELATGRNQSPSQTLSLTQGVPTGAFSSETMDLDSLDRPASVPPAALPGVPAWLAPAVDRCLRDAPEDRWPNMAALARALRGLAVEGAGLAEAVGARTDPSAPSRDSLGEEPNPLLGRERELDELLAMLAEPGAVVLVGPPGVGKSRLAAAAGRARRGDGPGWFCDLTEARSLDGLVSAIGQTLGIPLRSGSPVRQIGQVLAARGACTLVLDNFEQIAELAPIAQGWCDQAPELRLVLTSRVALDVGRELRPDRLSEEAATALLTARARERGVEVAGDPLLPELARRLECMPLSLELAAGRLGVLSVHDVLERLSLSLLRGASTDRHGTLHAALDWSWELLSPADRDTLAALSVFAGGFSLEAAEAVLAAPAAAVIETLSALIDRSMLVSGRDGRFRLLVSIREYASEKLGEDLEPERRHGRWFAWLKDRAGPTGSPVQQRALRADLENLTAACRRAVRRQDAELAVEALDGAWLVLGLTGPCELGIDLAHEVCALDTPPVLAARARIYLGLALRAAARMSEARGHLVRAVELARESGDPTWIGSALHRLGAQHRLSGERHLVEPLYLEALALLQRAGHMEFLGELHDSLGLLYMHVGRNEEAERHYLRSIALARETGDRSLEGTALGNLGLLQSYMGHQDRAAELYAQALVAHRDLRDRRGEGEVLGNLGVLARERGRPDEARQHYERALMLHREVGNRRFEAIALGNLGNLARSDGNPGEARALYDRALALHREGGNRASVGIVLANLGHLCESQGQLEEARRHYEAALVEAVDTGSARLHGWVLILLAKLSLQAGAIDEAIQKLDGARERVEGVDRALLTQALAVRAQAALAAGDREGARDWLARAERAAPDGNADATAAVGVARAALADQGR